MNDIKDMDPKKLMDIAFERIMIPVACFGIMEDSKREILRRLRREKAMTETAEKRKCPESWASDQAWGAYNMAREILDEAKKAEEG